MCRLTIFDVLLDIVVAIISKIAVFRFLDEKHKIIDEEVKQTWS